MMQTSNTRNGVPNTSWNIDTYYVVSGLIQSALRAQGIYRSDVLAPGTGPNDGAVRCPHTGQVRGVTRLLAL